MDPNHLFLTWVLLVFLSMSQNFLIQAQAIKPTRLLDLTIQNYTFKSFKNFKTGTSYNVNLPSNLTGINVNTVKYRSGSLKRYGASIQEFHLGVGVDVHPYVDRVLVVAQNIGNNWSNIYYDNYIYNQLEGYQLISPVLGLLAYNADSGSKELEVKIQSPKVNGIKIDFSNYTIQNNNTLHGKMQMCATFGDDGKVTLQKEVAPNICATASHGHFGLVVQSPLMLPDRKKIKRWKVVVGSSFGAGIGAFLLGLLLVAMFVNGKKKARMDELVRRAYEEEALQVSMAGHVIRTHNVRTSLSTSVICDGEWHGRQGSWGSHVND